MILLKYLAQKQKHFSKLWQQGIQTRLISSEIDSSEYFSESDEVAVTTENEKYFNEVKLIGRVATQPKISESIKTETPFFVFYLSIKRSFHSKSEDKIKSVIDMHPIIGFGGKITTFVANNVKKGSRTFIEGEVRKTFLCGYATVANKVIIL